MATSLAQPAYAEPATPPTQGGGHFHVIKPHHKSFWDKVRGVFGGDDGKPASRDLKVNAVPRVDPQPKAARMKPARRVRELTGRRTANARFYQLSDGRVQEELSASPLNYRDAKGDYQPIDTAVRSSDRKGFGHENTSNNFRSYFGTRSDRLARVELPGGQWVSVGLDGAAAKAQARVDGDTVVYRDAASGADISYKVTPEGLKEAITLSAAPKAPATYDFTVRTSGLRAWQRPDGSIAFYRGDFDGTPALVMPRPFMTDTARDPASPYGKASSDKVTQTMRWDGNALHVRVRADSAWLAAPQRHYPVVIDPTIKIAPTPSTSQDVTISSGAPTTNFDGSWKLSVGDSDTETVRSLVKFPLSGVPAGTKLDSAQLQLYYDQNIPISGTDGDVTVEAHRATTAWDETTATWNSVGNNVGELSGNSTTVDDGDAGTAVKGAWPSSTSTLTQYAINGDYVYNKDATAGDTYTWAPTLAEDGDYRVDVHYVAASDRATNAPYTVTYNGGSKAYTVNQQSGTNGVWTTLGTHPFTAGTTGKVVLGDGPASTSTAVLADAVRFTKSATAVRKPAGTSTWHSFAVKDTVQSWLNGTTPNYGFVLKAANEVLGGGGPRYEASEYFYNGETETYPRLILTYGRQGVAVDQPTTIHATGADLTWPVYKDPSTASGDDIVEYQVHRSVYQNFTPSAATLVSPVSSGTTSFTDTTATPTPADSTQPFGNAYYYMVAVKTKDGQLLPGPTQIVRLPKAGQVKKIVQGAVDTTLASGQPDTNQNTFAGMPWLGVGNNSSTYGKTRSVVKFPTLPGVPTNARILDAQFDLWDTYTYTTATGAAYEAHELTRDFDPATATWNKANSTTAWTTPGGDYKSAVVATESNVPNDPQWHDWTATSTVQGWVADPSTNHGLLVKIANEATPSERSLFLSSEAAEPQLRPQLVFTYVEKTAESTFFAPYTPSRMIPGDQYSIDVTVTNTTTTAWPAASWVLSYRWTLPDGTDVTNGGNQLQTALPKDLVAGDGATVKAQLKTPIQSDSGNKRTDYVLHWDLYNKTTGQWLSQAESIPSLDQNVAVEDPSSDQLGLEKFYQYTAKSTGAGSSLMNNLYAGNAVWSYNAFSHPGRGVSTFLRMAYNSQDSSDSSMGFGWSLQASTIMRLGSPLDFHPNPNPTTVTLTDGDGTSHTFTWDAAANGGAGEWKHPAGVHLYLQRLVECGSQTETARAWSMTRPDRTQFFFDCDGYLSSIVDKNGNESDFTWSERKSNNKPTKFLAYITDPSGRQTLTFDYYAKGDDYSYYDDNWAKQSGTNLTNPKIIDHVKSITDVAGRKLTFVYHGQGLLAELTDGAGSSQPKVFLFRYDMQQGNKNVKLVQVTDPRGHNTALQYYLPQTGDDPQFHWHTKNITDRLGGSTDFAYTDPDGTSGSQIQTVATDAATHSSTYLMDGYGRPQQMTNAKQQVTKLHFDADNNADRLEENNGAATTWTYDPVTGYPLTMKDAEANKNGTAGTTYTYQTGMNGHIADLTDKVSPEGRHFQFGYDTEGNLTSVTDPNGTATATAGDYTSTYTYDTYGQLQTAVDANGHTTYYKSYEKNGFPQTITDAAGKSTDYVYDDRGEVTDLTDALRKTTTQAYDVFGRPLQKQVPKDQDHNVFITTPAPEYDANDNVVTETSPVGGVTTSTYDEADERISTSTPPDTSTGTAPTTRYTYDKVGNLLTQTDPKGVATTSDPNDFVTSYAYDEIYQLATATDAAGHVFTYTYDNVGNVSTVVDPRKNATSDPSDFSAMYTYDLNHHRLTETDAGGYTTSADRDKDGQVVATTDEAGNKTLYTLDAKGQVVEQKVPRDDNGGIVYTTTQYVFDQVGNQTKVISPRGVATGTADDFVQETKYDEMNRVKEKLT
ncbi:MAG: DNRLRE domain-containing protein, partial [Actinoallomurus sp.]